MDWQPIETAPRDGTPVLACISGPDYYADRVQWDSGRGAWVYPCRLHGPGVPLTHWMALPEPPAGGSPLPALGDSP